MPSHRSHAHSCALFRGLEITPASRKMWQERAFLPLRFLDGCGSRDFLSSLGFYCTTKLFSLIHFLAPGAETIGHNRTKDSNSQILASNPKRLSPQSQFEVVSGLE